DHVLTLIGDLGLEVVRAERIVTLGLQHVHPVVGVHTVAGGVVDVPAGVEPVQRRRPDLGAATGIVLGTDPDVVIFGGGQPGDAPRGVDRQPITACGHQVVGAVVHHQERIGTVVQRR